MKFSHLLLFFFLLILCYPALGCQCHWAATTGGLAVFDCSPDYRLLSPSPPVVNFSSPHAFDRFLFDYNRHQTSPFINPDFLSICGLAGFHTLLLTKNGFSSLLIRNSLIAQKSPAFLLTANSLLSFPSSNLTESSDDRPIFLFPLFEPVCGPHGDCRIHLLGTLEFPLSFPYEASDFHSIEFRLSARQLEDGIIRLTVDCSASPVRRIFLIPCNAATACKTIFQNHSSTNSWVLPFRNHSGPSEGPASDGLSSSRNSSFPSSFQFDPPIFSPTALQIPKQASSYVLIDEKAMMGDDYNHDWNMEISLPV